MIFGLIVKLKWISGWVGGGGRGRGEGRGRGADTEE